MDSPRLPADRIGSQICHCAPPDGESPPDLSLRGSAGAVAISQYTPEHRKAPAKAQLPPRDSHVASLLGMTREGGDCKLANAPLRMRQAPKFVLTGLRMRAFSPVLNPKIHTKEITPCSVRNAETRSGMTRNSARSAVRRCAVLSRLLLSNRKRPAQSRMPGKCLPSNRPFPA